MTLIFRKSCWVQDIPARQTPIRHDAKATDFPATLQRVLQALNVPAAMKKLSDGDVRLPFPRHRHLTRRLKEIAH